MLLENTLLDLRAGARALRKERSFCLLAVLVLALGICAVATMYSVVDGTMLRGFSFPNADRLAGVQVIDVTERNANVNGFNSQIFSLDYEAMREQQHAFEMLAAFVAGSTVNLTLDGSPLRFTGAYVSADFFRILGVKPVLGHDFEPENDRPGAAKVALVSHELWQRDFGAKPDIVGHSVRINGSPATIIGVMPPGFAFPSNEQIWIPLYAEYPPSPRNAPNAQGNIPSVLGLLRRGVAFDEASAEFSAIAARLAAAFPDTNRKYDRAVIEPLIESFTPPNLAGLLWVMLAFCLGILLIACVNVMNMQFARATLRTKELAIRGALGATRWRLVRQMLTENVLLAALGAVIGILGAWWSTARLDQVTHASANPIPAYITFEINPRVLVAVVATTMVAAIGSGLVPALLASRVRATEALKESSRGNTSRAVNLITRSLVVGQILVTCILLVGALLQLQSILRRNRIDWGYDNTAVLTARMGLMEGGYPTAERCQAFYERLVRELRANPEYEAAALTNRFRMTFSGNSPIEIEGRTYQTDDDRPNANFEQVTDGFFDTLGVRLVEGRDFATDDTDAKQPVAIVNAAFARKHFGGESALGRRFRTVAGAGQIIGPWRTIVGVVSTVRMLGPFNNPAVDETGFYVPYFASVFGPVVAGPVRQQFATVVVRPRGGAGRVGPLAPALQRDVNKVDSDLPLYFVGSAKEGQDSFLGGTRVIASMFTLFGGVAVALAAVGLYGVMSFSVNQRMPEFGIRMALGANQHTILRMVLGQGAVQLAIGLLLGLGLTLAIGIVFRVGIASQLFEISPHDPATYAAVAALLTVVAFIATIMPARRATRVDPLVALRTE